MWRRKSTQKVSPHYCGVLYIIIIMYIVYMDGETIYNLEVDDVDILDLKYKIFQKIMTEKSTRDKGVEVYLLLFFFF